MTREQKLEYHLEMVIRQVLPDDTRLSAAEVLPLMAAAKDGQRQRAYERALVKSPMLIGNERAPA